MKWECELSDWNIFAAKRLSISRSIELKTMNTKHPCQANPPLDDDPVVDHAVRKSYKNAQRPKRHAMILFESKAFDRILY